MDLEMLMLSEVSRTEKAENHTTSRICGVETYKHQTSRTNEQRLVDTDNGLVVRWGE